MPQVWKWTQQKKEALELIFEGRLSQSKIAEKCGVSLRTIEEWARSSHFKNALQKLRDNMMESLLDRGVAYVTKESRIMALSQMSESAREEYESRPWLQEKRQIGVNRDCDKDDPEYGSPLYMINESFNRDAHAAFRDSLDDIAKELGHRKQQVDVTSNGETLGYDHLLSLIATNSTQITETHDALGTHADSGEGVDDSSGPSLDSE